MVAPPCQEGRRAGVEAIVKLYDLDKKSIQLLLSLATKNINLFMNSFALSGEAWNDPDVANVKMMGFVNTCILGKKHGDGSTPT